MSGIRTGDWGALPSWSHAHVVRLTQFGHRWESLCRSESTFWGNKYLVAVPRKGSHLTVTACPACREIVERAAREVPQ